MSDPAYDAALAVLRARVRLRFSLTLERLAAVLLERARTADVASDPLAYLRRLHLDDVYLAQACAARDEAAWAECARVHFPFMRDFARRFLRGVDATDLCDRVIAELWEKGRLERYEGRSSLRTWLGAIVAHAAMQHRTSGTRQSARDAALPFRIEPAADPEDERSARQLAAIVQEAIRALPRDQKLLLLLHYEQGLSLDRIAPVLDTSKATLSRRLKRVREDLRQAIDRAARHRHQQSGEEARRRVDLSRLELDLGALLREIGGVKGRGGDGL